MWGLDLSPSAGHWGFVLMLPSLQLLAIKSKSLEGILGREAPLWSLAEMREGADLAAAAVLKECPAWGALPPSSPGEHHRMNPKAPPKQ